MKILRIIRSVDMELGGSVEAPIQSSKLLIKKGHLIDIVSIDSPQDIHLNEFPLNVYAVGPGIGKYGFSLSLLKWLNKNIDNYDCVIIEGIWLFHSYSIKIVCRRHKIPYFVFVHGMLNPWSKKEYPLKQIKKWIYWVLVEHRVLKNANAVIFANEKERKEAKTIFWPNKYKGIVVKLGTENPPSDGGYYRDIFFKEYPDLKNKICLLFLSRIHPKKGCDILIEAFSKIKTPEDNLHLIMAGPDEIGWKKELENNVRKFGISKYITWTGMLTGNMKWGAYYSSDAFILPSHIENFGIVVVEAMGCGLPVLITDKINIWHDIENNDAGLIETDTIDGAKKLIRTFLKLSLEERNIMGNNAKECFKNYFGSEVAANSLLQAINSNISNVK